MTTTDQPREDYNSLIITNKQSENYISFKVIYLSAKTASTVEP